MRVRFLWSDSTDRHSAPVLLPAIAGVQCFVVILCRTVLMAVVRASGRHRLGLLRNRNADARTRKHFRLLIGGRQQTITGRIQRTTFWRLQSCRQPAVDDEVGASDISCPVAG